MRKLFVGLFALGLAGTASFAYAAGSGKIGVVDPSQVLEQSKAGQEVQTKLKAYGAQQQQWADKERSKLQKEQSDMQKNASVETAAAKKKAQEQFQKDVQAYQQEGQKRQQAMQQMRQDYLGPLEAALDRVIKSYAARNGYAVILDKGAVIYNEDGLDVTSAVLKAFDAAQPHAPAPASSPAPAAPGQSH